MALPSPKRLADRAAGAALQVSRAAAGMAVDTTAAATGIAIGTARAGARAGIGAARATGGKAVDVAVNVAVNTAGGTASTALTASGRAAERAAVTGLKLACRVLTGSDPIADDEPGRLADGVRAMFEPEQARRSRRVWTRRGRAHLELAAPAVEKGKQGREVRAAVSRHLQRLEGVDWVAVNEVMGRVFVAFDERRVSVEEVVGVVTAIEQARGGQQVFPQRNEHPGDLEPLIAALATFLVDTAAVGVSMAGKMLPVPAVTRHITVLLALLDTQSSIKQAMRDRIGPVGTDLVFTGLSALLHAATQSPTVPALNAVAAATRVFEMSARREVWQRREAELCQPEVGRPALPTGVVQLAEPPELATEPQDEPPIEPPGERPEPMPPGPIESYRSTLGPSSMAAALAVLVLTGRPGRSADMLKALTPKAAVHGRESFAAVLDLLMCRRGVLPMDGSAYRRLDRVDTVLIDSDVLFTGPDVVVEATATAGGKAGGWDEGRVWASAVRLLTSREPAVAGSRQRVRLEAAGQSGGGWVHRLFDGHAVVGVITVAASLDPLAAAVARAAGVAGHRLVLTEHVGVRRLAGIADELAPDGEPFVETVRRLQGEGHVVLAVSAADSAGLMAADVGVAVARPRRPPAWGADLVTTPGLGDTWRLIDATARARTISELAVAIAMVGNVIGGLLAAFGHPASGQPAATKPAKTTTALTMALGALSALWSNAQPLPEPAAQPPWHGLEPGQAPPRLVELPTDASDKRSKVTAEQG